MKITNLADAATSRPISTGPTRPRDAAPERNRRERKSKTMDPTKGKQMKKSLNIAATALVSLAMAGQSLGAEICARPEEAMALKAAALQQELMVAALSCGDVASYNRFVVSHQRELQDSDATLLGYFQRASQRTGTDDYNSYKTALANGFSLASLRGGREFCDAAEAAFGAASSARDPSLAEFVSAQPVAEAADYPACDESRDKAEAVAGGTSSAPTRLATDARN